VRAHVHHGFAKCAERGHDIVLVSTESQVNLRTNMAESGGFFRFRSAVAEEAMVCVSVAV
jgi:hypothetical protein